MHTPDSTTMALRLQPLAAMAALLERLERQPRQASATQYRQVVRQLSSLLADADPGPLLDQLLAAFPAAREVYENLRYDQAGLCRSPQEQALAAELAAAAAIRRIKSGR